MQMNLQVGSISKLRKYSFLAPFRHLPSSAPREGSGWAGASGQACAHLYKQAQTLD